MTMSSKMRSSSHLDPCRYPRNGRVRKNMQGCATCRIRKKVSLAAVMTGSRCAHFGLNPDAMIFSCVQDPARAVIANRVATCELSASVCTTNQCLRNIACVSYFKTSIFTYLELSLGTGGYQSAHKLAPQKRHATRRRRALTFQLRPGALTIQLRCRPHF
jgi:hypothetical protein